MARLSRCTLKHTDTLKLPVVRADFKGISDG
jgi:hypothetical protein